MDKVYWTEAAKKGTKNKIQMKQQPRVRAREKISIFIIKIVNETLIYG